MDNETLELVTELWRRRVEWMWNNAVGFNTPNGVFVPRGALDIEKLDDLIGDSEE